MSSLGQLLIEAPLAMVHLGHGSSSCECEHVGVMRTAVLSTVARLPDAWLWISQGWTLCASCLMSGPTWRCAVAAAMLASHMTLKCVDEVRGQALKAFYG